MAKRKRLTLPETGTVSPILETKSDFTSRMHMPIADVAGDVAGRAALEEVAREMTAAEAEGRVVKRIALADIDLRHLSRDRLQFDPEEMEALRQSLAERGQQTPVELVATGGGRYGLISGLRRIMALQENGETQVLALIKTPEDSQAAYQAMVEENELRANLSFYERANIAVEAVEQGVFATTQEAIRTLFAHAPKSKRSKIGTFVTLRARLGDALRFPAALPEHLGLALAKALAADPGLNLRIANALKETPPDTVADERHILEAALKAPAKKASRKETLGPGLQLETRAGRAVITGKAVDGAFLAALKDWAQRRACG